jgi:hypothetical protein
MVQNPSCCFSMSSFGPLQKFNRTFVASGAFTRSTLPALSTRGYSAAQTFVERVENCLIPVPSKNSKTGIPVLRIVARFSAFVVVECEPYRW